MRTLNRRHLALAQQAGLGRHGVVASVSGALAATVGGFLVAFVLLPAGLVLPVVGTGLTLAAATLALLGLAAPREPGTRLVFWNVASVLTLVGLCAALFGEAEAVALIERDR